MSTAPAGTKVGHGFQRDLSAPRAAASRALRLTTSTNGRKPTSVAGCCTRAGQHGGDDPGTCAQRRLLDEQRQLGGRQAGIVPKRHELRTRVSAIPCAADQGCRQTRAFCDPLVRIPGSCAPCTQHPSASGASTQGYRSRARATTRGAWGHSRVHSLVLREALPVQALAGLAPGTTNVGALADLRCAHVHSWAGGAPEKWMRSAAGAAMALTTPICLPSASSSGPCGRGSPAARSVGVHSTRSSAKEGPGPGATFRRASGAPALASSQGVPRHTAQAAAQEGCLTRAGSAPARCVAPQTREGRPASAARCVACHRSQPHRSRLQRVRWIASGYAPPVHDAFSDVGCRPGRHPKEGQATSGQTPTQTQKRAVQEGMLASLPWSPRITTHIPPHIMLAGPPTCSRRLKVRGPVLVAPAVKVRSIQQPCGTDGIAKVH